MQIFYFFVIFVLTLTIFDESFSSDVYDSDFFDVEVKTSDANETKKNLINNVKNLSLLKLTNKILNNESKKKFGKIIKTNITLDHLIKNIIIEDEIITDEKYIANIKINFNKEKIVNLLRNNKINYTDLKSDPFLIISSYNLDFNNIGLDKTNLLNHLLENKINNKDELINFYFPNLDPNDRYILPFEKIIYEDIKSFNQILNKYNLNQLFLINISKLNIKDKVNIRLKTFNNKGLQNIDNLNFNDNDFETSNELFDYLSDEVLFYMSEWWKNKNEINNTEFNIMECKILSKNFNDLVIIKSNIINLSQVKYLNTKKIHLNNNIVEFYYYGNLNVLIKSLSLFNIFFDENNDCIITTK